MSLNHILLTNDDGYDAPGISAAVKALSTLGKIHVVAPRSQRSACSHTITLRKPISVERLPHNTIGELWAVDGSPADCVRLALAELVEEPIDLVVSGINAGANSGSDVYYSGTVAGAREGAIMGLPSIAISQAFRQEVDLDWSAAADAARQIVPILLETALPGPGFWSLNLPPRIPGNPVQHIHYVPLDARPMPLGFDRREPADGETVTYTYQGPYWTRSPDPGTDYGVLCNNGIAATAVPLYATF